MKEYNKDLLLVARPDHSLQIYNALLLQSNVSFHYLTYKVVRLWVKKLLSLKRIQAVSKNAFCSIRLTIVNLCRYKFHFKFAQKWDETRLFDPIEKRLFKHNNYRIIHYWPEYGDKEIARYAQKHPDVFVIADIHMPQPEVVYSKMIPVYRDNGINPESTHLASMVKEQSDLIEKAHNILVPSSFVADTYRTSFPGKDFYIVPYGITISPLYNKTYKNNVRSFVYAGRISLEKGADFLLEFFSQHPSFMVHLYGKVPEEQQSIFERYRQFPNIFFHEPVPKASLQSQLRLYDVGIHLSRFDAYSLAVGEMIGAGIPVIVSDQTGNKDDIINERFGLVIPLDMKAIDSAIKTITDVKNYNAFVDNIDDYIRNRYKSYGERVIDFYKDRCSC